MSRGAVCDVVHNRCQCHEALFVTLSQPVSVSPCAVCDIVTTGVSFTMRCLSLCSRRFVMHETVGEREKSRDRDNQGQRQSPSQERQTERERQRRLLLLLMMMMMMMMMMMIAGHL